MGKVKEKIVTLAEQIEFIAGARKVLENPKATIVIDQSHLDILRDIGENLHTIRMWLALPELHQAAMHVLDEAYDEYLKRQKAGMPKTPVGSMISVIAKCMNVNTDQSEDETRAFLKSVSAIAMIGIAEPNEKEVRNG